MAVFDKPLNILHAYWLAAALLIGGGGKLAAQSFPMADGAQWETCTGTFYDSGGSGGDYAANENLTATLCPAGGPGAGPFSSITFATWAGAPGTADQLAIYNGDDIGDPLLATGSGANPLLGQTFTSTDPSGCLTFVWTSDATVQGAGWVAQINTGPDAGTSADTTVCSTAAPFGLFSVLNGDPDAGGQWTLNSNLVSGTFDPAVGPGGVYTYTVPGVPPCVNATATVTVTLVSAANAGFDNTIEVCTTESPFSMRSRLLGTPQPGGDWTIDGDPHADMFDPATDTGGVYVYVYTVLGNAPCPSDSAHLTIDLIEAPEPGTSGTLNVCSTAPLQDLFASLGGAPEMGGTWTSPGPIPHSGQFNPASDPPGVYTYTIAGQAPCTDRSATVTVTVQAALSPGTSGDTTVCSNGTSINLKNILGTSATGTWAGPSAIGGNNLYSPVSMTPGTYTYTVAATGVCPAVNASVEVMETVAPVAGGDGSYTVCSSGANVDLFTKLTGTPDVGGTWTAPGNVAFPTGVYVPGAPSNPPGTYTYTVAGAFPCANDIATVTITQVPARNAGTNGTLTTCSNSAVSALFGSLGGGPEVGGTWYKPVPPGGVLVGGLYNPANATHPQGIYTYVLLGTAPCPNDTATVSVTEIQAPWAGNDNNPFTLCNTSAPVNLITALGGSPNGGGSWLNPVNAPFPTGLFNPASGTPGLYKYIVPGTAPCANDTGFVTVVVNQQPNAGISGDSTVCSNAANVPLLSVLGGTPGGGGTWSPSIGGGTYDPGTGAPTTYTYTITALSPCVNVSAVATMVEVPAPDPGVSDAFQVCSNAVPFYLFPLLDGSPDVGGTWSPGDPTGLYTPAANSNGTHVFTYTVAGTTPCANATSMMTVTQNAAPDPGEDADITVCEGTSQVDLFPVLGGSPDAGGTWQAIGSIAPGTLNSGVFFCATNPPGTYHFRYNLPGNGNCPPADAEVIVHITGMLNAGTNGTCTVCDKNPAYNLFNCLGSGPQPGGIWKALPGGQVVGQNLDATVLTAGTTYQFRYVLTGSLSCASDSAVASVTVAHGLFAGNDVTVPLCGNASSTPLFPYLTGAEAPGTWRKTVPPGPFSGSYNPATDNPQVFLYITQNSSPCQNDTARVTVQEVAPPNAGCSPGSITRCQNGPAFDLTQILTCSPAPNGTWRDPSNTVHNSTFVPGVDPAGTWTYTVNGASPCGPAMIALTIVVNPAANAGLDGDTTVCENSSSFQLANVLNGAYAPGGTWKDEGGAITGGLYAPGTLPFDPDGHTYTYVITGASPCPNDTARVTVFENPLPDAGVSNIVQHCLTGGALDLFTALGGTPSPNGSWTYGSAPHNGTYVPGTDQPGNYVYTVSGVAPCSNATATVLVQDVQPPDAGTSTTVTRCTSNPSFGLFTALTGNPSTGGTWYQGGQILLDPFFDPGSNSPGSYAYWYVIAGEGDCPADSALLTVTLFQEVNAGCDGDTSFCNPSSPAPLFPFLGCSPATGGSWRRPNGQPHSGIFNPATDASGDYWYRKPALGACSADSAKVTVSVVAQHNAGDPGQVTVCSDNPPFLLMNYLTGSPEPGGVWSGPIHAPHSEYYFPQFDASGVYTYTFAASGPCPADSAKVNVIEYQKPWAGNDGVRQVCSDEPGTFALITVLTGGPNPLGSWKKPGLLPHPPGTYDPGNAAFSPPGLYTYVVQGNAPCINDTATVTIIETQAPEAGISTAVQICNSAGVQVLSTLLGGTPGAGGTWTGPGHVSWPSGTFDPSTDPPGLYTYHVNGVFPCGADSATVTIGLVSAPNAGLDGSLSACLNDNNVDLFTGLGGNPQAMGTWTGPNQVNGILHANEVDPGIYTFTYTVSGGGACPVDEALVTVTVSDALFAGDDSEGELCSGMDAALFGFLDGAAQPGGAWTQENGPPAIDVNGVFHPSVTGPGTFNFTYVLAGSPNCPGDTASLSLVVIQGPNAGTGPNNPAQLCTVQPQFNMINLLSGLPDTDGAWFNEVGDPVSAVFDPATSAQGTYTYVVPGAGGCDDDSATVTIQLTTAPDAGATVTHTFCSNDAQTDLFSLLGGTPSPGGSWSYLNTSHSNVYVPLVDNPGTYYYTVSGSFPCSNDTAAIIVSEAVAPYAGQSNTITRCSSQGPFDMRVNLVDPPPPSSFGSWTGPNGAHGATFDPAVDSSGVYTYVVTGDAACAPASATLTVSITYAPDAGNDSTLAVCNTTSDVDLFAALGADADSGGTWTDVSGVGAALQGGIFDATQVGVGGYQFQYNVPANGVCAGDQNTLTVNVGAGLDPGIGDTLTICGGDAAYNMFDALDGTPSPGGVWSSGIIPGVLTGEILDATLLAPGGPYPFSYTVTDPACGEAFSVVLLSVAAYPDPGADTTVTFCSTMTNPFGLLNLLGGDPDPGGTWTTLGGVPVNPPIFTPGTDVAGGFRYQLTATPPCSDTSAVLTIIVNEPPLAGPDTTILVCNSDSLDLDSVLVPGAQPGGAWSDNSGSGWLTGSLVRLDSLDAGIYAYTYQLEVPACPSDMATYTLHVAEGVHVTDTVLVCDEVHRMYTVTLTIAGGDPATYAVTGLEGAIAPGPPYVFTSIPIITSQPFSITVTDANNCGPRVVEGVSPCRFIDEVLVPESFTPNGDNVNDVLIIPGIEGFPRNTISIFNRWGAEVYKAAGYDNRSVVWKGVSDNAMIPGDLPTGTYYYVLELGNGVEPFKGFIYLNR